MAAMQLARAVRFHDTKPAVVDVSTMSSFDSVSDALRTFEAVLHYDAHTSLSAPLPTRPEDPYMCCVDLTSKRPGIVQRTRPRQSCLYMERDELRSMQHATCADTPNDAAVSVGDCVTIDRSYDDAVRLTMHECTKRRRAETQAAQRGIRNDAQVTDKCRQRAERKQLLASESKDDRRARVAQEKEDRAARVKEKQEKKAAKEEKKKATGSETKGQGDVTATGDAAALAAVAHVDDDDAVVPSDGAVDAKPVADDSPADTFPSADQVFATMVPNTTDILPPVMRVRPNSSLFASPVPHMRHIDALQQSGLSETLTASVLRGEVDDALTIVEGPPGTGKTQWIARAVSDVPKRDAVLVCAPSNVAAANAYVALMAVSNDDSWHNDIALCLPPARIPSDVAVASDDARRRIVVSTVSGRNAPRLAQRSFEHVFLDEAAQCSEACTWTVLRPDVKRLYLIGDTRQLSAVACDGTAEEHAHARSLMTRLVQQCEYPVLQLAVQARMHPNIAAWPSAFFYDGIVTDDERCATHVLPGSADTYICKRVSDGGIIEVGTSYVNPREAEYVADEARMMRRTTDERFSIVIIAPYRAHCRQILAHAPGVDVHTVDSFQGREADVVLLSICRTGDRSGFWNEAARLNVALTRAKRLLIVYGSFDWTESPLREFADDAIGRGVLREGALPSPTRPQSQ